MRQSLEKKISEQIQRQTREKLPAIGRRTAQSIRNPVQQVSGNTGRLTDFSYFRAYYNSEREDDYQIRPGDFYSYSNSVYRSTEQTQDGQIVNYFVTPADLATHKYLNAHYSVQFMLRSQTDVKLLFSVSHPVSMYLSYTPAGGNEVRIKYRKISSDEYTGITFYGGEVTLDNVPSGWHQLDIFIYAHDGLEFFKQLSTDLSAKASAFKLPGYTATAAPTWSNSYSADLGENIISSDTEFSYTNADADFPTFGMALIETDYFQFGSRTADEFQFVEEMSSSHNTPATIYTGAITASLPNEDAESEYVDLTFNWTLPTLDIEGNIVRAVGKTNVYEIHWKSGYDVVDTTVDSISIKGDHVEKFRIGSNVYIESSSSEEVAYYTVENVRYVAPETVITLTANIAGFVSGSNVNVHPATLWKLGELTHGETSFVHNHVPRGFQKVYTLTCNSLLGDAESSLAALMTIHTGKIGAPYAANSYVSLRGGTKGILIKFNEDYFTDYPHVCVTEIAYYVQPTTTRVKPATPPTTRTYSGRRPLYHFYVPTSDSSSDIYYHVWVEVKSLNGLKTKTYVGVKALGEDIIVPTEPSLTTDNLIVEFSNIDAEPYGEEVLGLIRRIYLTVSGGYLSPVIVKNLDMDIQGAVASEVVCYKAAHWGACTTVSGEVTATTVSGEGSTFATADSGLRGMGFIDNAGDVFVISSNTVNTLIVEANNDSWPVQGEYGILSNHDAFGADPYKPIPKPDITETVD